MLFVLALCRSGAQREQRRGSGGGGGGGGWWRSLLDRQEQRGLNPSAHTSPRHSAPLSATRSHGEAHLLVLCPSALLKENDRP